MNKVEAIAALVGAHTETYQGNQFSGNKSALAAVLGRHPSLVTRFAKAGTVPARYNETLLKWAKEHGVSEQMAFYLEDRCPCCNQKLPVD